MYGKRMANLVYGKLECMANCMANCLWKKCVLAVVQLYVPHFTMHQANIQWAQKDNPGSQVHDKYNLQAWASAWRKNTMKHQFFIKLFFDCLTPGAWLIMHSVRGSQGGLRGNARTKPTIRSRLWWICWLLGVLARTFLHLEVSNSSVDQQWNICCYSSAWFFSASQNALCTRMSHLFLWSFWRTAWESFTH